jgi:hypothetical protein
MGMNIGKNAFHNATVAMRVRINMQGIEFKMRQA